MMSLRRDLRRHPFPVVAHFDRVVALSFAFPESVLRPLVPDGMELDTYEGLGFITVALVWTRGLRPAVLPPWLGKDFFLAGYRVFTRLRDESGRRLRGLKILHSETNRRSMVWLGNLMTRYGYEQVHAELTDEPGLTRVRTTRPDGTLRLDLEFSANTEAASLPPDSPFPDWATARRFAGPMPFTFSEESPGTFVVVEGSRQNWTPRPVQVRRWHVSRLAEPPFAGITPRLANAFAVENIPYRWEKGRLIKTGGARA